jgi:hypothetical protein
MGVNLRKAVSTDWRETVSNNTRKYILRARTNIGIRSRNSYVIRAVTKSINYDPNPQRRKLITECFWKEEDDYCQSDMQLLIAGIGIASDRFCA